MADGEDVQPLVCDNGTGMVKVSNDNCFCVPCSRMLVFYSLY